MTTTAPAAPATARMTDAELREEIERLQRFAQRQLDAARAKITAQASIIYAAEWNVEDAVKAEAAYAIYTTALSAPEGYLREGIIVGITGQMSRNRQNDPFGAAVQAARADAARDAMRLFRSEIDAAMLLERMA